MLSINKRGLLAAVAALTVMFGTTAAMTSAGAQGQPAQIEKPDGQNNRQGDKGAKREINSGGSRESNSGRESRSGGDGRSGSDMRSDRSRETTTRTTVRRDRDNDRNRQVVVRRDRDRDHDRWRGRNAHASVSFVVLGPRAVYRSYGSGWCRALHNGRHWAPHKGWHSGRHVGAVRCG